jgi:F0F1-type ATP synthase assembly protein I
MSQKTFIKLLAVASNFIFELLLGLGVGYFLGRYLDGVLNTDQIMTSILMVVFGIGALIVFMRRVYLIGHKNE